MSSRAPSHFNADALWQRFIGAYGADAVRRKFGDRPPPEWITAVSQLNDFDLQRGMRRLMQSGKPYVPSLPEFIRACRMVGQDLEGGEMKSGYGLPALTHVTDAWGAVANRHLLGWIWIHARRWRPQSGLWGGSALGGDHAAAPNALCAKTTLIAVRWKNEWARMMREADEDERKDGGRALWLNCMAQAEREIVEALAA